MISQMELAASLPNFIESGMAEAIEHQ